MNAPSRPSALRAGRYVLDGGILVEVSTVDRSLTFAFGEGSPPIPILKTQFSNGVWEIEYFLNRKKQTGKLSKKAT